MGKNNRDDDGDESGIFGQRLDGLANKVGEQLLINSYTTGEQLSPFVARKGDGEFVVFWRDAGSFGELRHDLKARWFDVSGTGLTTDVEVALSEDGEPILADVEFNSAGQTIFAWQALGHDGDGDGVVARRYDVTRAPVGGVVNINSVTAGDQGSVDVASGEGGVIAVWQGPDSDGTGIFARRFTNELVPTGEQFQVNTYTNGEQITPHVSISGDGSFVVIWNSIGQDGDGAGVFAQLFDPTTARDGAEVPINSITNGDQGDSRSDLSVAANASGDIWVVWESDGIDGSSTGIGGRPFCIVGHRGRACGDPLCDANGLAAITASDALVVLNAAIGLQRCANCVCDVINANGTSATDALVLLQRAVGQPFALDCPPCS